MIGMFDRVLGPGVDNHRQSSRKAELETVLDATHPPLQPAARRCECKRAGGLHKSSSGLESQSLTQYLRTFATGKASKNLSFRITDEEDEILGRMNIPGCRSKNEKARHLMRWALLAMSAAKEGGLM